MDFGSFLRRRQHQSQRGIDQGQEGTNVPPDQNFETYPHTQPPWNEPQSLDQAGRDHPMGGFERQDYFGSGQHGAQPPPRGWHPSHEGPYREHVDYSQDSFHGPISDYESQFQSKQAMMYDSGYPEGNNKDSRENQMRSFTSNSGQQGASSHNFDIMYSNQGNETSNLIEDNRGFSNRGYQDQDTKNSFDNSYDNTGNAYFNEVKSQVAASDSGAAVEEAPVPAKPVKKKKNPKAIVRDENDKKKLVEFDIIKAQINWAHFSITKRMLKEAHSMGNATIDDKKNFDVNKLEFYCKLCDVQAVSASTLYSHLTGKKHLAKVEKELNPADYEETVSQVNEKEETSVVADKEESQDSDFKKEDGDAEVEGLFAKEEGMEGNANDEYENKFFNDFKFSQVKSVDWESYGITQEMLRQASYDCGKPKAERSFVIYKLQYYCKLCDVQTPAPVNFYDHLTSKKHLKKAVLFMDIGIEKEVADVESTKETLEKERQIYENFNFADTGIKWEMHNVTETMLFQASFEGILGVSNKKKQKDYDIKKLEFYCRLCSSQMVGAGNFADHLKGKKHKTAYQDHVKFCTAIEFRRDRVPIEIDDLGQKSVIKMVLSEKQYKKKISVGLSQMTEFHSIYQIWIFCDLCGEKMHKGCVKNHVTSFKHRILYFRKYEPKIYDDLSDLHERGIKTFAYLNNVLEKRKEDECGEPTIKRFDPSLEGDIELSNQEVPFDKDPIHKKHYDRIRVFLEWVYSETDESTKLYWKQYEERAGSPILDIFRAHGENPGEWWHDHDDASWALHKLSRNLRFPPNDRRNPHRPVPAPFDERQGPVRPPPILHDMAGPYPDRRPFPPFDRRFGGDEFLGDLRGPRGRIPPIMDSDPYYRGHGSLAYAQNAHLDPDPLKRVLVPAKKEAYPYLDSDPLKRVIPTKTDSSYIDPDPLKRVLPSQKAKQAKPVLIDYSHGKEEKTAKTKAREWEDDIKDVLGNGGAKGPDSLALLNSSYSSPKREISPPTRELPFSKSYLDRFSFSKSKSNRRPSPDRRYNRRDSEMRRDEPVSFGGYSIDRRNRNPSRHDDYMRGGRYSTSSSHRSTFQKSRNPYTSKSSPRRRDRSRSFSRRSRSNSHSRSKSPISISSSSSSSSSRSSSSQDKRGPTNPAQRGTSPQRIRLSPSPSNNAVKFQQRNRSPLNEPQRDRSPLNPYERNRNLENPVSTIRSPKSPPSSRPRYTNPPSSRPRMDTNQALYSKSGPSAADLDDEDAQADRIANMLLSMKSSIIGREMDDPHLALQALLSSEGMADALLAVQSKISSIPSRTASSSSAGPQTSRQTREKVAFSFAGRNPASSVQNVLGEEESEEEN